MNLLDLMHYTATGVMCQLMLLAGLLCKVGGLREKQVDDCQDDTDADDDVLILFNSLIDRIANTVER